MKLSSRTLALVSLSFAVATVSDLAHAQGPCSGAPGERVVGMSPAGQGIASFPICVVDQVVDPQVAARREAERRAEEAAREEAARKQQAQEKKMIDDVLQAVNGRLENLKKLENDPTFKKMGDGFWFYIEPGKNGAPASLPCTAKFVQTRGMVSLVAVGGRNAPIGVTLEGPDVPKPSTSREINVSLSQNGEPPVTAKMSNFSIPGEVFGTLAFASGNNLKEVMTGMKDEVGEVKADFEGKTVFEGGYARASEMKKRFSSCVQQVKE